MNHRQILNIMNFVRSVEPRREMDLVTPVKEQIRLMKKHHLCGTFLLQYDAMSTPEIMALFQDLDPEQFEFGVWHEVVQPQVEACNLTWRGRFPWDWHTHCGFSVGYTQPEREKLIDVLYEKFREHFGYFPRVFGSCLFDSYTIRYINDKYGADAFYNCKEQFGTDGYTLWGGYYGQAYYPSKTNVFIPGHTEETQVPVPLFRMFSSDPIYQYDTDLDYNSDTPSMQHGVITMEPVYPEAGGNPLWVNWCMRENFNDECLSFGFVHAGQENSYGWNAMAEGLTYQFALIEKLQQEGKFTVEPIGKVGRWFKENYAVTPASAISAHTAFDDENKNSVWYSSRFYRINLYGDQGKLRIRDLHLYSDALTDPFEEAVCTENYAVYEALPLFDGYRYSGNGVLAGGYITYDDGTVPSFERMHFSDEGNGHAAVRYSDVTVDLFEDRLRITAAKPFTLENRIGIDGGHLPKLIQCDEKQAELQYCDVRYCIKLNQGTFVSATKVHSENGVIEFFLHV